MNLIGAGVTAGPGVTVIVVQRGEDTLTVKVVVAGNAALGEASLTIRTDLGTITLPITIVPNPNPITTVAGTGHPIRTFLNRPYGVAVDSQGSLLIADTDNDLVRKVSTDGTSSVVAGSGELFGGFSGDGGPATSAQLRSPQGVTVDSQGNIFIADTGNNRIRKVGSDGTITTVAGNGDIAGFYGDGGPATSAALSSPSAVAVDSQGNIFIADTNNGRVRKVSAEGTITTVAGSGVSGFAGDEGPATSAQLALPTGVAVDAPGNLFIADRNNNRIRKVSPDGTITTAAGGGFDGDGGPATSAQLFSPQGVAVDSQGNLLIAETDYARIRKVSADGTITTVAGGVVGFGGDGGPATSAALFSPTGVAADSLGNLFIADSFNDRIRKVTPDGTIRTLATAPGDGGPATSAPLALPLGVAVDDQGNIFIADRESNAVRKVSANGTITTVAGSTTNSPGFTGLTGDGGPATSAQLGKPNNVAVDSQGNLFIAEIARVRKVNADGTIDTVAGDGWEGFGGDGGPATSARLRRPSGVAVDSQGNLFIADNHRIRKVSSADGTITTVAANGSGGFFGAFGGDGGPATNAQLGLPGGVAVDSQGNLFIADSWNHRIRKVTPDGIITTVVGTGVNGFSGDGGPAANAQLSVPKGVTVDSQGNLFIADTGTNRIRKVSADGTITTVAGTGVAGFSGDGGSPLGADLNSPTGIAVDGLGNLFIADSNNYRVRKVSR